MQTRPGRLAGSDDERERLKRFVCRRRAKCMCVTQGAQVVAASVWVRLGRWGARAGVQGGGALLRDVAGSGQRCQLTHPQRAPKLLEDSR